MPVSLYLLWGHQVPRKSTLLNIIGCMDIPTSGSYYLKGSLVNGYGNSKLSKIRGSVISFVFFNISRF